MKPNEVVTLEHVTSAGVVSDRRPARVMSVRGDYVYLDVYPIGHVVGALRPGANVHAFHRRTGKPRRASGWTLATKHCDPLAGRGTTR